jgi:hypothetical protein
MYTAAGAAACHTLRRRLLAFRGTVLGFGRREWATNHQFFLEHGNWSSGRAHI